MRERVNGVITYESDAASLVNFHPVVQFNGTADRLDGSDLAMDDDASIAAFYVLIDRGSTDNHSAFPRFQEPIAIIGWNSKPICGVCGMKIR